MKNLAEMKVVLVILLMLAGISATPVAYAQATDTDVTSELGEGNVTPEAAVAETENEERLDYIDTYPGKLVPFVGMAVAVLIVWIVMGMVRATDRHRHETIRQYLEKGVEVPWELLVDDGNPQTWKPVSDLRKATVWLALGLGAGLTAWIFSGNPKSLALGLIFDFIGLGYLIVWKLEPKQPTDENAGH